MIDDAGKIILTSESESITVNSYSHKNRCRLLSGTRILKVSSHGKNRVAISVSMEILEKYERSQVMWNEQDTD